MLLLLAALAQNPGLTIRLTVPASTPATANVHVAGTFNNWNPGLAAFRLERTGSEYHITLPDTIRGPVEFKFTLGTWETVELTASGGDVQNRSFRIPASGAATYTGAVESWSDGRPRVRPSTRRPTVTILDTAFAMPQLGRSRRVWLYLPPDYATTTRTYPVLYLHDGQNVFDNATSFAGEWGVDETLDSLHALGDWGAIVVAVDHGGPERLREYLPWRSALAQFSGGLGEPYADFLVETLKPYIDAHYRTRPDRANTGIGGSSAGGHISFYAAMKYPEVFGRVMAFSPSFFVNPEVFAFARDKAGAATRAAPARAASAGAAPAGGAVPAASRYYFNSGLEEGSLSLGLPERVFATSQRAMLDTLAAAGIRREDMLSLLPADGAHSEWFWRREFPSAYLWLFRRPS